MLLVVGLDGGPIEIGSSALVLSARSVFGSLTGSAQDGEDTLGFSVLQNIRSRNEIIPLKEAAAGYARMMSNAARFRRPELLHEHPRGQKEKTVPRDEVDRGVHRGPVYCS